ncbi:MAG: bifunctional riboflavin kinase/FAD synthetase [Phascolarctobacterium sp.]|nr:bifunctional riboflavin kinase/FAD synthetase [Phascolarctobacterium sp.]
MKVITELGQLHKGEKSYVVALGTFDGLHVGHQDVINVARRQARQRGHLLAVFTFQNHPLELICPERVPVALLTKEEKYSLLEKLGVELLIDLPFDRQLASLSPAEFLQKLLLLGVSGIVVGENFTYGYKGAGNCKLLAEAAMDNSFSLEVRPLVKQQGEAVSSTLIRQKLLEGHVEAAARLLGRSYTITGIVAHGNERGRLLGFPTANLELADNRVALPPVGVYAVRVRLSQGSYKGMANIGNNPTFGDVNSLRLETHIFDFSDDIYGQSITIEFVAAIREQVKFNSLDALITQLQQDKSKCQEILQ